MARERRFSGAQVTAQLDETVGDRWLGRESLGERAGLLLPAPDGALRGVSGFVKGAFYNRFVTGIGTQMDAPSLVQKIGLWAREMGFSQTGVADVDLSAAEPGLQDWLASGFHGDMSYMAAHGAKRARPAELVPGTVSVITARMDYLPATTAADWQTSELARLRRPGEAIVSLYARGRDYHKVLRSRLQKLADRIAAQVGPFGHRVFTDSAPVLEAELAVKSGLGWRGKHTLVLSRDAGSMFFLGEIFVDLALPSSAPVTDHCGGCRACIDICPTQAIVGERRLDARRCISYLTIEHKGAIPLELRPLIGNRIYGCDDCQLICPWNKFARKSALPDFDPREGLTGRQLVELFNWSEADFLRITEGSPIRRIGHERWQRNVAVALGNALAARPDAAQRSAVVAALHQNAQKAGVLVLEHINWALEQDL